MNTKQNNHYIVFGGAGYLGIYFVHYLASVDPNSEISIVTTNLSKQVFFRQSNVKVYSNVEQVTSKNAIIINLAYSLGDSYVDTKKKNDRLFNDIESFAKQNKVDRVIHVSSIVLSTSKSKWDTVVINKRNTYYYAKSFAEKRITEICKKGSIPISILRSGNIVGPGSPWINQIITRLIKGLPIVGKGESGYSNATFIGNLCFVIYSLANNVDGRDSRVMNCCEFGDIQWIQWINEIDSLHKYDIKKWDIDCIESQPPSLKQDLKQLKAAFFATAIPLLYKGAKTNNFILKFHDFFRIKLMKSKVKNKVGSYKVAQNDYYDLADYNLMSVFLCKEKFGMDNIPKSIVNNIPFNYAYVLESIENWIIIAGYKKIN